MQSKAVSIVAITDSRTVPEIAGVRAIRVGRLTALVTGGRKRAPTASNLRRYHRTVAAIASAVPAILPVRFGTTMVESELTIVLQVRAASLRALLRRVRGRVQMTLRLTGASHRGTAAARLASPRSGRAYLRRLAARARDVPGFGPVREVLEPWIEQERVERLGDVVSIYHLIPRRSVRAYERAAQEAIAAAGLRAVVTGPFPAYAFTAL